MRLEAARGKETVHAKIPGQIEAEQNEGATLRGLRQIEAEYDKMSQRVLERG